MLNCPVANEEKKTAPDHPAIRAAIREAEIFLGEGRILVRPSGTEPLVRVMAEGKEEEKIRTAVQQVCRAIEETFSNRA